MVPLAIVGRAVATGVGEGVGVGPGPSGSSADGTGVGDGDFFADASGDAIVFFFGEGLVDVFAFFFFFEGVGVFLAVAFFFFGDALGFGVVDLAGLGEAFATLSGFSSEETCPPAGAPLRNHVISKHKQKRLTGAHLTEKISGRLRRGSGILQLALVFAAQNRVQFSAE